jgi:hypothetical protein
MKKKPVIILASVIAAVLVGCAILLIFIFKGGSGNNSTTQPSEQTQLTSEQQTEQSTEPSTQPVSEPTTQPSTSAQTGVSVSANRGWVSKSADVLNVRSEPNKNSPIVQDRDGNPCKMVSGESFIILEFVSTPTQGGWYHIKTNGGLEGYCFEEYVVLQNPNAP